MTDPYGVVVEAYTGALVDKPTRLDAVAMVVLGSGILIAGGAVEIVPTSIVIAGSETTTLPLLAEST